MRAKKATALAFLSPQLRLKLPKAIQRALEIFDYLISEHIGRRQIIEIGKGFILYPKDIEAGFIARQDLGNIEFTPAAVGILLAPSFGALKAILRIVAGDEILQVRILHRILLQREVDIRAEIIDPHGLRLRIRACWALIEKDNVRLYAWFIKDTSGKAEDRMQIGGLQQAFADYLTRAALKQHVIRHDHGGLARCL